MSPRTRTEILRLLTFGVMGTINTLTCYALFATLVHTAGWPYQRALVADYGLGIALGFALHRRATFADRKRVRQAFVKYVMTLALVFSFNLLLLEVAVRSLGLSPLVAQAAVILLVTSFSYQMQKHWVFRVHGAEEEELACVDAYAMGQEFAPVRPPARGEYATRD